MPKKTTVIRFLAPVIEPTVNRLFEIIDQRMPRGVERFKILLSSPGGNVMYGVSAFNFLRGIPAEVCTHNFGSVDSIGVVLFCAGEERLSVPQGRFLLHGVGASFQGERLELRQLHERVRDLEFDLQNISTIIAEHSGMEVDEVKSALQERTPLNPKQAMEVGLVHRISNQLVLPGEEVVSIDWQQNN